MKRYKFSTFTSEALKGIVRNPLSSTVSIISLVLALVVLGSFFLLKVNIEKNLESLGDFHKIVVYLELDADTEQTENVRTKIKEIMGVSDDLIEFTSKEAALEAEKAKYGEEYAYIFDSYKDGANPLPDSFTVSYSPDESDIDYHIQLISGLEKVENVTNRKEIADKITNLKTVIERITSAMFILLFIVSVFVVGNTLKLTHEARKNEIRIMKYIGATNFYIEFPFVIEGCILGIISSLIAYAGVMYGYKLICDNIVRNYGSVVQLIGMKDPAFPNVQSISGMNYAVFFLLSFLAIGILTGFLGTLATKRHLKA